MERSTKLSVFCDRLIEAGWLAAIIAAPLFFNIYSSRVFEPDKLTLVRSIALVMAAAWLVRTVEVGLGSQGGAPDKSGNRRSTTTPFQWVKQTPLVLPTLLLVIVYLISTVTSVTPRVSLLGSYQRLQGTYTTLSYIIIFFLVLQGLRTKEQVERLVTTVIIVSLPISIYGILQHYKLDPLPWGGDVSKRVASNMGNSIFIAAYMIMVVPLTTARVIRSFTTILTAEEGDTTLPDTILGACYVFILAVQLICIWFTQSRGPWLGLLAGMFVFGLLALLNLRQSVGENTTLSWREFALAAGLALMLCLLLISTAYTYLSLSSSSPVVAALGALIVLLIAIGVIVIAISRLHGVRWLWLSWISLAVIVGVGLVLFNLPVGPLEPYLESLRKMPYIGRLGRVFETEKGTGKVRVLIWEGAIDLITPHEPIAYAPDKPDKLNALRPLIGYGPESMYVAYNRFYPPDLAHYEKRNASPDRSHNETFDALVITGGIGFLVYMFLFASVFYYGFKWLGVITTPGQRNLFIGLWIGSGLLVGIFFWLWKGAEFIGVGLPFGIMLGILAYTILHALFQHERKHEGHEKSETGSKPWPYQMLLIALVSAIIAHFVEIHFGIAIASTRTYFWTYAALMVVLGMRFREQVSPAPAPAVVPQEPKSRRRRRRRKQPLPETPKPLVEPPTQWLALVLACALIGGLILTVMVFDYISNQTNVNRSLSPSTIIRMALTVRNVKGKAVPSYGMLLLFSITWLMSGVVITSELVKAKLLGDAPGRWAQALFIYFLVSLLSGFIFAQVHTAQLAGMLTETDLFRLVGRHTRLLDVFYLFFFGHMIGIAVALFAGARKPRKALRETNWLLAPIATLAVIVIILITNVAIIKGDIIYKLADPYDRQGQWDTSIVLYQQALHTVPNEDFYYLFIGRAFLEKAKRTPEKPDEQVPNFTVEQILNMRPEEIGRLGRKALLEASRLMLERAKQINPLNTDHSANLGRLHRTWAELTSDPQEKAEKIEKAIEYYRWATTLSPHNAQLFNEWALVYLTKGDLDKALKALDKSLALDQQFDQTYLILGDVYRAKGEMDKAIEAYEKALEINPKSVQARSVLGALYAHQGDLEKAIAENQAIIKIAPRNYEAHKNLAVLYHELGQDDKALSEARVALDLAPEKEKAALQNFITQLMPYGKYLAEGDAYLKEKKYKEAEKAYLKALEMDPTLVQALSALGYIYAQTGRLEEAIEKNKAVLALNPNDFTSHRNLAIIYQQLGRIDEAIAEAQKALELAPDKEKPALETFIAQLKEQGK